MVGILENSFSPVIKSNFRSAIDIKAYVGVSADRQLPLPAG